MKKLLLVACVLLLASSVVLAGGIVTNTNQSAEYVRTLNRNASTSMDAVYFNPAGVTKLTDGLHFYASNQFIFQSRTIENDLSLLSRSEYTADVNAFLFPDVYLAYKMDKLAVSAGVGPVGGGGSADYKDGAPSFELMVANMLMANPAVPQFSQIMMDASFKGSSAYIGGRANVSYAINDMISLAVGGQYVYANNSYEGSISGVSIMTAGGEVPINSVNIKVDAKQTGSAFGGIVGANFAPNEDMNIGLRYETLVPLEVENDTKTDGAGLYPDGAKTNADIPAFISFGVSYAITPQLRAEASANYFMNTGAKWSEVGNTALVDDDYEGGISFAYQVNDDLVASAGYLYSMSGAKKMYQSDISYSLSSNTVAAGVGYQVMPNLNLNFGILNTFYMDQSQDVNLGPGLSYTQTYKKSTLDIAIGASYAL